MAATVWSHLFLTFCILLYFIITFLIFIFVNNVQKEPYMDEEFHIPQAQKFCKGTIFEWDKKITTPPGLYLLSMGILVPLSRIFERDFCTVFHLRFINVLFSTGTFYVLYCISCKLHKNANIQKLLLLSANMALLPVLYFFTFLYYTDVGSLFFVLLMYLHRLYHRDALSAIFGFISLFFRQTNIVWVFFVAADRAFEIIQNQIVAEKKYSSLSKGSLQYLTTVLSHTVGMPFYQRRLFFATALELLKACFGYICLGLFSVCFLLWNNGIVLGDRDAHQVGIHLSQVLYFLGFTLVFTSQVYLEPATILRFVTICLNNLGVVIVSMAGFALCLQGFSYAHPYLLADNRHYPFYLWRWILGRPYLRHLLIPGYLYAAWITLHVFQTKNSVWKMLFCTCLLLSVVPQMLIEFRYFIVPYVILRLNQKGGSGDDLVCELVAKIGINFLSFFLFKNYPFVWPDSNKIQRFMW